MVIVKLKKKIEKVPHILLNIYKNTHLGKYLKNEILKKIKSVETRKLSKFNIIKYVFSCPKQRRLFIQFVIQKL